MNTLTASAITAAPVLTQQETSRTAIRGPSSLPSQLPFWIISALTLIAAHYQVWVSFNAVYKIFGALVVVAMLFCAGFLRLLQKAEVAWLLLYELVLIVSLLVGHYEYPGSGLWTASTPVVLLRCFPLLLCGYTLGKNPAWDKPFLLLVAGVYWLFSIPDLVGFIRSQLTGIGRSDQQILTQGLEGYAFAREWASGYTNAFVYFAPLLLFFGIMLCRLYPTVSSRRIPLLIAVQLTFFATALLAGFSAVILMFFVAMLLIGLLAPARKFGRRLVALAGVAFLVLVPYYVVGVWAANANGTAAQAMNKVLSIFTVLSTKAEGDAYVDALEQSSSYRSRLIWNSVQSFLESPIIGVGLHGVDSSKVGGHSFFADTAATYGLVGLLPIVMFFGLLLTRLWKAKRAMPTSWPVAASLTFVVTLMFGLTINPYLLDLLSLSYFLFLFLGYALADSEIRLRPKAG